MTPCEFHAIVARFRGATHPGKNIYLWCGDREKLLGVVGPEGVEQVSALALPGLRSVPSVEEAKRLLNLSLMQWLQGVVERNLRSSIAVVCDLAVLAYFGIGIEMFYQYHASDRRMTILSIEPTPRLNQTLPAPLEYNPTVVERFYRELVPPHNIVEGDNGPSTN